MQHFSEIPNYPAPIPPPIRNRRSFAGFWSRSVCLFLASSSARPAAALRDLDDEVREMVALAAELLEAAVVGDEGPGPPVPHPLGVQAPEQLERRVEP